MSIFHNYSNPLCSEGHTPSNFSYDPSILSLKEMITYELKKLAYYIVKLDDLQIDVSDIIDFVIANTSLTIINADFKRDKYLKTIELYRDRIVKLEEKYKEACKHKGYPFQPLQSPENGENKMDLSKSIEIGEKQTIIRNTYLSKHKKTLYDIIEFFVKDASLHLNEIDNYGEDYKEGKKAVIHLLNRVNFINVPDEKWKTKIEEFSHINYKISSHLQKIIEDKYGPIEEKQINLSIKKGKAILVSGHFYQDLEKLLKATEGTDINIYTHNDMMLAHTYKELNKYSHLAGHYQRSINNLQLDFATFPGAILITKNSQPQIDIIRGRIFTLSEHPAFGMSKLENDNFEALINAANEAKGFNEDIIINPINGGYNKEKVLNKLHSIIEDLNKGKYKHLFIVGMTNQSPAQNFYFEKFFNLCPDDCFIISLAYIKNKPNIWHIDSYYDFSLIYLIIDELIKELKENINKTTMFLTQWNMHTISHIFNLKNKGIENIYLADCCSYNMNPSLITGLDELYNVKNISTNPKVDIDKILKQN